MIRAIYFTNEAVPDPAIMKGLQEAGCEIYHTRSITETMVRLGGTSGASAEVVLIADLQSGAIPLLAVLGDRRRLGSLWTFGDTATTTLPPTLIVDRDGTDVGAAVRALQYGVHDYVLANSLGVEREMAARLLVERSRCIDTLPHPVDHATYAGLNNGSHAELAFATASEMHFNWNPADNVIRCLDGDVFVSRAEGRIFDMLVRCQGQVVGVRELLDQALNSPELDMDLGLGRLRAHMMRLRQKLQPYPSLANRIINVRGSGYMLV